MSECEREGEWCVRMYCRAAILFSLGPEVHVFMPSLHPAPHARAEFSKAPPTAPTPPVLPPLPLSLCSACPLPWLTTLVVWRE